MKKSQISQLFEAHYSDLIVYGIGITNNLKVAEDLVSEAFYKLVLNVEMVNLKQSKFWLMRVMKNSYIDSLRKDKRLAFHEELETSPDVVVEHGLERLLQAEIRRELMLALQQLPPKYAEAMILHYFLELDGKEIANYLNLTYGQVRTRLYRGRHLLKERWEIDGKK